MKRSEAIKLIASLLDSSKDFDIMTRADNLLCHLEDVGMLPPTIKINEFTGHISSAYTNEWEPEDNDTTDEIMKHWRPK